MASLAVFSRSALSMPRILRPKATFWSTERCGKSAKCWKTVVTGRLAGSTPFSTCPSRLIVPELGSSWPPIMRSVVVLPQPDGPSSVTYSPFSTCRFAFSTAMTLPGKTR